MKKNFLICTINPQMIKSGRVERQLIIVSNKYKFIARRGLKDLQSYPFWDQAEGRFCYKD